MKNNIITFFLFLIILCTNSLAKEFTFETSEIQVLKNGELIKATNGKANPKKVNEFVSAKLNS